MKSKNDLKIGDRVRIVSVPALAEASVIKIRAGMTGTVKALGKYYVGVEFDDNICGHTGSWGGKQGHCWNIRCDRLEKIDETKADKMNTDKEVINHPSHYTSGKVECIDAIESATNRLQGLEAVCTGNIIKYVWRWKFKNGVEDLEKASWYLHKLIEEVKNNSQE